jgi:hypothetical protein
VQSSSLTSMRQAMAWWAGTCSVAWNTICSIQAGRKPAGCEYVQGQVHRLADMKAHRIRTVLYENHGDMTS